MTTNILDHFAVTLHKNAYGVPIGVTVDMLELFDLHMSRFAEAIKVQAEIQSALHERGFGVVVGAFAPPFSIRFPHVIWAPISVAKHPDPPDTELAEILIKWYRAVIRANNDPQAQRQLIDVSGELLNKVRQTFKLDEPAETKTLGFVTGTSANGWDVSGDGDGFHVRHSETLLGILADIGTLTGLIDLRCPGPYSLGGDCGRLGTFHTRELTGKASWHVCPKHADEWRLNGATLIPSLPNEPTK